LDQGKATEKVHAVSRGAEGSKCGALWTCLLLGLYRGLGEGEARMPALQARSNGTTYPTFKGVKMSNIDRRGNSNNTNRNSCIALGLLCIKFMR
jgi:hypothetical protein